MLWCWRKQNGRCRSKATLSNCYRCLPPSACMSPHSQSPHDMPPGLLIKVCTDPVPPASVDASSKQHPTRLSRLVSSCISSTRMPPVPALKPGCLGDHRMASRVIMSGPHRAKTLWDCVGGTAARKQAIQSLCPACLRLLAGWSLWRRSTGWCKQTRGDQCPAPQRVEGLAGWLRTSGLRTLSACPAAWWGHPEDRRR